MSKTLYIALIPMALLCLLWACPKQQINSGNIHSHSSNLRVQDYFPLQVGDSRVYQIQFGTDTRQREIKIIKQKDNRFYDNENGVFEYDTHGLRSNLRYMLKYPLQVGNKWISVVGITNIENYVIVDVNRTVTVPAGTYKNCIVVRSHEKKDPNNTLEAVNIYAPQVGLIKIITSLKQNDKSIPQWTVELVSYRRNNTTPSTNSIAK